MQLRYWFFLFGSFFILCFYLHYKRACLTTDWPKYAFSYSTKPCGWAGKDLWTPCIIKRCIRTWLSLVFWVELRWPSSSSRSWSVRHNSLEVRKKKGEGGSDASPLPPVGLKGPFNHVWDGNTVNAYQIIAEYKVVCIGLHWKNKREK